MRLLFSEAAPDYGHYLYPYVIWGFLEPGETPADAFDAGFLPGNPFLDRYYVARHIRVPLQDWRPSSENRRILRHGAGIASTLFPRSTFQDTPERRNRWLAYARARFAPGAMPPERLERLMAGPLINHILVFFDRLSGVELGSVLLYLEPPRIAFYHFAFFELESVPRCIGMILMTQAVERFATAGFHHIHLGTCYSESALYKAQFEPLEFFNGFRWSRDVSELKHLVRVPIAGRHRLETPEFLAFQTAPLQKIAESSHFRFATNDPAISTPTVH